MHIMRKIIIVATVIFIGVLAGVTLFGPERSNPATDPSQTLAAVGHLTPQVSAILDRSCRDCHSNETTWPWYSHVPPLSWGVINHVNDGRRHMNFSKWGAYDPEDAREFLVDICALARKRDMPLPSYLWLHSDARLSDQDIAQLCEWTKAERARD
jgi:hypothetical protein